MDGFLNSIQFFFRDNAPGLIFLIYGMLLFGLGGIIFSRVQKYMLSLHIPEDKPPSSVQSWWSGLMLSGSVFLQLFVQFMFFLPILIGLATITFVEYNYMMNPDKAPWFSDARSDG